MARAGRKRKNVNREPNGRRSRKGEMRVTFDQGTSRAQLKMGQYGTQGADPIGRAWAMGLLGEDADALRDTARRIFSAYWPMLAVGPYSCTLADKTSGGTNDNYDSEAIKRREDWLARTLITVDKMDTHRAIRAAFDDLIIDHHPDFGPKWLDSLIWHKAHGKVAPTRDIAMLEKALMGLRKVMS
jgi:hypothetical protein